MNVIRQWTLRWPTLAVLGLACGALIAPSQARADACAGGAVALRTAKDSRLTTSLPIKATALCDLAYDVRFSGNVTVGDRRLGQVRKLKLVAVGQEPRAATLAVPASVVKATRSYARRTGRRYAYIRLSAIATRHDGLGQPIRYALRLRVSARR